MPWDLVSDKTGKRYTFDDDVKPDDALWYMDDVEKPAEWGDVLKQALPEAKRGMASAVAGVRQGLEDLGLAEPGQAAAVRREIAAERKAEMPENMTKTQEGVLSGVASLPEMALSVVPGLGAARGVMTAKNALTIGLSIPGATETAREYGEQREGGMSPLRSLGHAAVAGGAEIVGERLPLKYAVENLGEHGFKQFVKQFVGRDIAGEELTYLIQSANRKASINPEMSLGEFVDGAYTTAVAAATGSGVVGTAAKGVDIAASAVQEYSQRRAVESLFKQLADPESMSAPPTEAVSTTDAATTKTVGKSYGQLIDAFRASEMPEHIWSEAAAKYAPKMEVQHITPEMELPDAVSMVSDVIATQKPEKLAAFVAANLMPLSRWNIDVPALIQDDVNQGKLDAAVGTSLINSTINAVDGVVSKMYSRATAADKDLTARYDAFVADNYVDDLFVGTEVGQWQQAFNAGYDFLMKNQTAVLNDDQMRSFGFNDEFMSMLPKDRQGRAAAIIHGAKSLDALTQPGGNGTSIASSAFGKRWIFNRGLLHPNMQWNPNIRGKPIAFGHDRGKSVTIDFGDSASPGHVNIVKSTKAPGADTVMRRVFAITRQWVEKYAPGMSVTINLTDELDALGWHQFAFSDGTTTMHEIALKISGRSEQQILMTLAHEFGHALFTRQYHLAPKNVKEVLRQQWLRHLLINNWNKSFKDVLTQQRPYDQNGAPQLTVRQIMRGQLVSNTTNVETELADYWLNFMEWHAHTMERMLVADYQGMQGPVLRFWKNAFAQLKRFFNAEHSKWAPEQTMHEWLQLMQRQEGVIQASRDATATQMAAMNVTASAAVGQQIDMGAYSADKGAQESFGAPVSDASRELPAGDQSASFEESIRAAAKIFKRASPEHGAEVAKNLIRFNETWSKLLGSFQILELNRTVPGAMRFLDALRAKFGYKSTWLRGANRTANEWEGLGKEQAGAVAKLLLTEAEQETWYSTRHPDPANPGGFIFVLDPARTAEFGITEQGAEVYSKVRDMFYRALNAMEQLGIERINRQFADDPANPQRATQVQELTESYNNMRSKPYTPFSRFGQFYVKIRAKDNGIFRDPITGTSKMYLAGQTVYFETFDSASERDAAVPELQKRYGNSPMLEAQFNTGKIHDIVYSMRNLPPEFARAIAERLDLSQEQLREYNDLLKDLASDSSFVKHMKRKANISGYSPDALRGFADYFLRFSNNYAKGKSAPEFESAMADVREYKRQLEQVQMDTTKLDEFYNWMQRTFNYVMNPGNELAELKSFVTAWYLGFNIPTAAQNLTQLPFWTFPYLSKRFGVVKTLAVMKTALSDVLRGWKNMSALSADEKAAMTYALEQGFIDESFATSIAQFAEGTAIGRLTATATRHRLLNWYNHKALFIFQKTEEINRRTSLLAAYRLNRSKDFDGDFDRTAFARAREAVEVTQNEYALENRPEFMRGNKSVIFQFMHYVQNAIFRMTPWGDEAWKRLLLMQLSVAGLLGMPFAEDLLNLSKFLARKFGMHFEPEMAMRQLLMELNVAPDWVLRGAAAHLGPFDLSYRYSLGRVVPGMEALGSNKRFNEAILDAVGDMGGAGASIALNALKAVASLEDPRGLKTLQYVSPSFVKYGLQALDANKEGGVIARNGAMLAPLESSEVLGMSIGLQPKAKSVAYTRIGFETEVRNYWMTRRQIVLENMYQALRTKDREALADARKRLVEYNKEVRDVEPAMMVGAKTLQRSMRQRFRAAALQTITGSPFKNPTLTDDVEEAVPLD